MKIRLISGACYALILVLFYCLKVFVHDFAFDGLIYAFALIGTYEILHACGEKVTKKERALVYAFSAVCIPACAICQEFFGLGWWATGVCFAVLAVALLSLLVISHDETSLESLGLSLLSAVYPTILLSILVLSNHMSGAAALGKYAMDSRLLILFIFVVSPCADSIAYIFGCYLRKYFPKKMAPKLSPNKTVIGGIGGLVGGVLGAAIFYFIYNATAGSYDNMAIWLPVYLFVGLLVAVATAFGDLVESCIKRKAGIKDMGKIMPGHGGVLDRIDGTLFANLVVYAVFAIVHTLV